MLSLTLSQNRLTLFKRADRQIWSFTNFFDDDHAYGGGMVVKVPVVLPTTTTMTMSITMTVGTFAAHSLDAVAAYETRL